MAREKASLLVHQKETSDTGLIREVRIWMTPRSERYPEGVRYRLVLVEPRTEVILLLYDNHWPKGHHVHEGTKERPYQFTTVRALIEEFRDEAVKKERTMI